MEIVQSSKDLLLNTLQSLSGIVERRHTIPALANVLLTQKDQHLTLTTNDSEMQMRKIIEVNPIEGFSQTTVNAKKFLDILKALPDEKQIKINVQDHKMMINSGRSKFNLQTIAANEYPEMITSQDFIETIVMPQKAFKQLISKVHYTMAVQDIRYYLNGMLLILDQNNINVVATDGHRLAFASTSIEKNFAEHLEIIMPRKVINELNRLLNDSDDPIQIDISAKQIRFSFNDFEFTSKLIEGKFPDYNKVIPVNYTNQVSINREEFTQTLQRVAILSNEKFKDIRCQFSQNNMLITSTNTDQEVATEELEIQYENEPMSIGFNVMYLLDFLNNTKADTLIIHLGQNNNQSVLITLGNDDFFKYVVMPLRI